jgi:hypothetical protein
MTVVFNALGLPFEERPQSPLMKPGGYRYFDQNNVFNGCMRDVMHEAGIYQSPWGITLKQLKEYFGCRADSDYRGGDDFQGGARELSMVLAREMSTPGHFLVANYHRRAIGQTGGGHHSPLGAYSPSKDMVLIMDVARLNEITTKKPPTLLQGACTLTVGGALCLGSAWSHRRHAMAQHVGLCPPA